MAILYHWLLLVLLNAHTVHVVSNCVLDELVNRTRTLYICDIGNVTIFAGHPEFIKRTDMKFDCGGTNVAFPRSSKNAGMNYIVRLILVSCPVRDVIRFVNELYDQPTIDEATIHVTNKFVSSEELDNFKNARILSYISETETTIYMNASYSWSNLKVLEIIGGNNLQFIYKDTEVNMTKLQSDSLSCLKTLEKFNILDNKNIEFVGADAFKDFDKLQILNLTHGKLKYIEAGAFSNMSMLRSLDLSYNMLESIANGVVQHLQNLVEIFLQGNKLKVIGSHAFAQLNSLRIIDISNGTISSLSEKVFMGSDNIEILKAQQNNLESLHSNLFQHLNFLNTLYLGHNELKDPRDFNVFNWLKNLQYLDLSNNQINILPKSLFLVSTELKEIDLSNNKIESIGKELVHDTRNFETSYDIIIKSSEKEPFEYLTKLKRLNLAGNEIGNYLPWEFVIQLEYLNLSRNQIETYMIDVRYENYTELYIEIDLSYNKLLYMLLYTDDLTTSIAANSTVILTGNPIECDCYNYGLYYRLNGFYKPGEPNFILDSNCTGPSLLKGQNLKNLSPDILICNVTDEICLENCSSCIVSENEIKLDCVDLPSEEFTEYSYFTVSINLSNQPINMEDRYVNKLNLSNAGIQSLTFVPNNYLNTLDVSRNNLTTIPDMFLKNNYTLYLSNNPFECECEFIKNILDLYNRGLLPDYNEMTCANGDNVAQIDINELCNRSIRLISLIGCSTIGSFVALVAVIKLYLNAHNIWMSFLKLFCKRKYERTRIELREIGKEAAKVYDLFISYAHQDENFVAETLLPKLENEFNQKVCVHTRDWVVGNVIANQIIESVENSRRTVIILSEHFLMSEWSEVEFHTAHSWSIQEGKSRIIIILLKEEVARDDRMDAELKSYLASNTYLLWGDPLFWEKLHKVLPGKIPKNIW